MREKKEFFLLIFLCLFSLGLFWGDKKGWLKKPRGFLERPILATEERIYGLKVWVETQLQPIFRGRVLEKEVSRLQLELQRLAVDQNRLSSCLEENERMRRLLGAPLPAKWKFLPAKVIGGGERMRIDKGEKNGVKPGMMVVEENILVGKIEKVELENSLVLLPTSPGQKIPVLIKRPGKTGVQARGLLQAFGGGLVLDRVLQSEDIQKGDLVVSAGDEDWLPDLLIGQITEVLPKSAQIYQKAQVGPIVEYDKLRIVFIVISNGPNL